MKFNYQIRPTDVSDIPRLIKIYHSWGRNPFIEIEQDPFDYFTMCINEGDFLKYFKDLIEPLIPYHPILFFIEQKNVEHCIQRVANERKTDDPIKFKDWLDLVIEYIDNTPYACQLGYTGYHGIIRYFIDRQTLSLNMLKSLSVSSKVLLLDNNFDELFDQMMTTFI